MPTSKHTNSISLRLAWVMVWRDLRMMARRRRTYLLRVVYAGGLVLTAVLAWWGEGMGKRVADGGVPNISEMARVGIQLFQVISAVGAVLVAVLAPAFTAGAIAQEKERGTLGLLQTTLLGHGELLLGKAVSRLATLFVLIAAGMPVLASCLLFGGVGPAHVLMMGANLFAIALLCASVGLFCSVLCLRTHTALISSYLALVGYAALPPLIIAMNGRYGNLASMRWVNPAVSLAFFLDNIRGNLAQAAPGAQQIAVKDWLGVWESLPFCLIVSLLYFKFAIHLYPRFAHREPTHFWRRFLQRIHGFFERMNRGMWSWQFRSDRLEGNPVAWKERNYRVLGRTDNLIRVSYSLGFAAVLVYLCLAIKMPRWWEERAEHHIGILACLVPLWYLVVSALAASAFAIEKDRLSWDSLLTTTLAGPNIFWAKVWASFRASLPFLAFPVLHLVMTWIFFEWGSTRSMGARALLAIMPTVSGGCLQLAVGMLFSLRARSVLTALIWTLGFGLAINFVLPLILATVGRGALQFNWEVPLFFSPVFSTIAFFLNRLPEAGHYYFTYGHIILADCDDAYDVPLASAVAVTYLLVSLGLLGWMAARFDRLVGRTPH